MLLLGSTKTERVADLSLSLVHKVTLGPAFPCVTRNSGVCEGNYAKPEVYPSVACVAVDQ